jgi:type VII secretion protein EccB
MASRRDELSAYTFARKRTVAAFLRPAGGGSAEDAPRAVRAVVPGLVLGALAVAGFGAYGMLRPSAPKGWDKANAVIVDKQTTTRYVMLDGVLHPVLNMSSARLLLSSGSGVEYIDDAALNSPSVTRGATVGIPYAPDSLPSAQDAAAVKTWAACDRSSADTTAGVGQRLFVLGGSQAGAVAGNRLRGDQALYVQTPEGTKYLVDSAGRYHELVADKGDKPGLLEKAVFGASDGMPQQVSTQWLKALIEGSPISLPHALLPGFGHPYTGSDLAGSQYRIGDLIQVTDNNGTVLHYVVMKDGPHRISDFARGLVEAMHASIAETPGNQYKMLNSNVVAPFESGFNWPTQQVTQANLNVSSGPMAACAVYDGTMGQDAPQLGVWLGPDFPVKQAQQPSGTAGVYVTPGTGLLLQAVSGGTGGGGKVFLLTDTGLRYPLQMNSDGNGGASSAASGDGTGQPGATGAGSAGAAAAAGAGAGQNDTPAARLGYGSVTPLAVPLSWAELVPAGPALTKDAAEQQQGS